jgi:hypothetical protein
VFYPAADNKKGYEAYYGWFGPQKREVTTFWTRDKNKDVIMYYRDWGSTTDKRCQIVGLCNASIVKSYFGNVTDEYIIEPVVIPEENNTDPIVIVNNTLDDEIVITNSSNSTVQTVDLEDNNISNVVTNSTNTVNNQGIIDSVKQYWFDFKNANLNNVTFNFLGGN